MTEETELTHTEQAMAYYGEELSADEKFAFERHLEGCKECQELLADARRLLPAAEALLAFKPKYTVEEQVRRFDGMVAAEAHQRARRFQVAKWALAAVALVALTAGIYAMSRPPPLRQVISAPPAEP
jgi:anti-sigma factor RsiW